MTQLTQYGNTLLAIIERQDAEKMAMLLQTQGLVLSKQSLEMQKTTQDELNEEKKALKLPSPWPNSVKITIKPCMIRI